MFSRVDLSTGALAGGSRYAFAGGNPISTIEFNGHDWWATVAGLVGAAVVVGGCIAIGRGDGWGRHGRGGAGGDAARLHRSGWHDNGAGSGFNC